MPTPTRNNYPNSPTYRAALASWQRKGKSKVRNNGNGASGSGTERRSPPRTVPANAAKQIINALVHAGHMKQAMALGTATRNFRNAARQVPRRQVLMSHLTGVARARQNAIQALFRYRSGGPAPNANTLARNLRMKPAQARMLIGSLNPELLRILRAETACSLLHGMRYCQNTQNNRMMRNVLSAISHARRGPVISENNALRMLRNMMRR